MKISVVVPTYKPELYLKECLDSLLNQSLSSRFFEVLLVINGTKKSANSFFYVKNLVESYRSKINIKLFEAKEASVSLARNLGIDNASGDFICFLDDDDLLSDNYLKNIYSILESDSIIITNVKSFKVTINRSNLDYLGRAFLNIRNKRFSLYIYRSFFSSACCKAIDKGVIGNYRFDANYKVGEDSFFMACIACSVKKVKFASEDTIYYRRLSIGSASRTKRSLRQKCSERFPLIIEYIKLYIKGFPYYSFKFIVSRIVATIIHVFK